MSDSDPQLSKLYRKTAHELPPAVLDRKISDFAHQAVEKRARAPMAWMWPVASVATLLIGVGLLVQLGPEVLKEPGPMLILEQPLAPQSQLAAPAALIAPAGIDSVEEPRADMAPAIPARPSLPAQVMEQEQPPLRGQPIEAAQGREIIEKTRRKQSQQQSQKQRQQQSQQRPMFKPPSEMLLEDEPGMMRRSLPSFDSPAPVSRSMAAPAGLEQWLERLQDAPKERWMQVIAQLRDRGHVQDAKRLEELMHQRFDFEF